MNPNQDTLYQCEGPLDQPITVVIPAFNEELTIANVIQGAISHAPNCSVLVIDDGSTDATAQIARESGAQVISHPINKGNGAAIKTAIRHIKGGIVAIIDGDGQHDPSELPKLIEKLDRFDLAVGSRSFQAGEGSHLRNIGNIIFSKLATFLAEQNVPDLTSGFRAFRHKVAKKFMHVYPNGYSFPSTSSLCFITAGYNVTFVPINVKKRAKGAHSKLRPFMDGFRFLTFIMRIISMANPNKIFFPVGLILSIMGVALTIRNLTLFGQFSSGAVLFLAGGVNIIFFGLILDQFASLRIQERENEDPC